MGDTFDLTDRPGGAIGSADEGVMELRRCGACHQSFGRPRGTDLTHRQMADLVTCALDATVEPSATTGVTTELRRCGECGQSFGRPRGSALTHRQSVGLVTCAPDAEVEPLEKVGRWARR